MNIISLCKLLTDCHELWWTMTYLYFYKLINSNNENVFSNRIIIFDNYKASNKLFNCIWLFYQFVCWHVKVTKRLSCHSLQLQQQWSLYNCSNKLFVCIPIVFLRNVPLNLQSKNHTFLNFTLHPIWSLLYTVHMYRCSC